MVSEGSISQISDSNDEYQVDICSVASSSSEDDNLECDGAVVLSGEKELPSFGNISVSNSSDVHFGNKTSYHGPVTIKQFLYANEKDKLSNLNGILTNELVLNPSSIGEDNFGFAPNNIQNNVKTDAAKKPADPESRSAVVKGFRQLRQFFQEHFVVLVTLLALLIISLAILLVVLLTRSAPIPTKHPLIVDTNEQDVMEPVDYPLDPSFNSTLPGKLKLVARLQWLAQPPSKAANPLTTPVPYVIISHTATENCSSRAQCIYQVRNIQTYHIESNKWWDIGYNFLVGGDGEAYEGRGWTSEGAHTFSYNSKSIGISFIGTFNTVVPPQRQITAFKLLVQKGLQDGYIDKNYKLRAARQFQATESPGAALYKELQKWPHWAKEP